MGPGGLAPDDPFFWFAAGNLALHTFPPVNAPRKTLQDNALDVLTLRYSDFASRSGTPEPGAAASGTDQGMSSLAPNRSNSHRITLSRLPAAPFSRGASMNLADGGAHNDPGLMPIPPPNCLHQPTELGVRRKRWEVKQEFVDDRRMILGDAGWFPGAQGHRFTFEASAADVSLYVHLNEVPQAQLLFVLNTLLPPRIERPAPVPADHTSARIAQAVQATQIAQVPEHPTSSDSDLTEEEDGPVGRSLREARRQRRVKERRAAAARKRGQKLGPERDGCDDGQIGDVFGSVMLPAVPSREGGGDERRQRSRGPLLAARR